MKRFLIVVVVVLAFGSADGQNRYVENNFYEFSGSFGKKQNALSLSWAHMSGIGKGRKLVKAGYGVRLTSYFGKDQNFITAPARLTSRQTGPQVLFSKTFSESLDTVRFARAQINSLNIFLNFEYAIRPRLDLAFNIDVVGLSVGGRQAGKLQSTLRPSDLSEQQTAKPTAFNVLLVSDNDIGSLNSEFLLRYWFREGLGVKVGFCFLFAEYQTDNKLIFDNDRFRNKASMALLGITYNPFKSFKTL